jgi:hypothetical protein
VGVFDVKDISKVGTGSRKSVGLGGLAMKEFGPVCVATYPRPCWHMLATFFVCTWINGFVMNELSSFSPLNSHFLI